MCLCCHQNRNDLSHSSTPQAHRRVVAAPGCLGIQVSKAKNIPRANFIKTGFCVLFEVFEDDTLSNRIASGATTVVHPEKVAKGAIAQQWVSELDVVVSLPCPRHGSGNDKLPSKWNFETTKIRISLCDEITQSRPIYQAGSIVISLCELLSNREVWLELFDDKGDTLCAPDGHFKPCKLLVGIQKRTIPPSWSVPSPPPQTSHPHHVFMMTRGTRGDVQPFVCLARGMAEQLGYLVTICTEMRWKPFVLQWSNVAYGKIQFCCSGGDTEAKTTQPSNMLSKLAKSEHSQMLSMANAEANFFRSATVFVDHVEEFEHTGERPVDSIIFSLTVAGIAIMIGQLLDKRVMGFILQPSCIPSAEKDWKAVQRIHTHELGLADTIEEYMLTGQETPSTLKSVFKNSIFDKCSLNALRKNYGLKAINTYEHLHKEKVPMVIPMKQGTFHRPCDWWSTIVLSDFIFLRSPKQPGCIPASLGDPLDSFLRNVRSKDGKIGLMTFSSMRVSRAKVFKVCVKMIVECKFNLSMIYVGKKFPDEIPGDVQAKFDELTKAQRIITLEKADFGELFKHADLFIIQGGLGTTVEAGRMKKPVVVSGPLMLDQRFWGEVCHNKGIGPPATHIDNFEEIAVAFANGALDPSDPEGWQAKAREADWGNVEDDGVESNVKACQRFLEVSGGISEKEVSWKYLGNLKPVSKENDPQPLKACKTALAKTALAGSKAKTFMQKRVRFPSEPFCLWTQLAALCGCLGSVSEILR